VPDSNVQIARRNAEAHARRDNEAALRDISPEIVYDQSKNSPEGGLFHGYEGLAEGLRGWHASWEDYVLDVVDVVEGTGDKVVVVIEQRGRGKATGAEVEWLNAYVAEVREQRIVRITPYPTVNAALEAAGLPSRPE
jgi:ketosteroid isomerase-like protein